MEKKITLGKGWCTFWSYMAGMLQDQGDRASSKRATLFALLAVFCYQNIAYFNVASATVNMQMYWGNLAAMLTFGGFIISEFFKPLEDTGLLK